jgi:hypothetical protein
MDKSDVCGRVHKSPHRPQRPHHLRHSWRGDALGTGLQNLLRLRCLLVVCFRNAFGLRYGRANAARLFL